MTRNFIYLFCYFSSIRSLGLVIVKSIIEAHKGNLLVESNHGKGTEVVLKIPVYISYS